MFALAKTNCASDQHRKCFWFVECSKTLSAASDKRW